MYGGCVLPGLLIVNNHNGTKEKRSFICKMVVLKLKCLTRMSEGQYGNGSGSGKLSLLPSFRQRHNAFRIGRRRQLLELHKRS